VGKTFQDNCPETDGDVKHKDILDFEKADSLLDREDSMASESGPIRIMTVPM
jgi:hypothetical protein